MGLHVTAVLRCGPRAQLRQLVDKGRDRLAEAVEHRSEHRGVDEEDSHEIGEVLGIPPSLHVALCEPDGAFRQQA